MSLSKHSEAHIIAALKQLEAGRKAEDVAREVGVSKHTISAWKAKYGGMEGSEATDRQQHQPARPPQTAAAKTLTPRATSVHGLRT